MADPGLKAIEYVYREMQIDREWSIRGERSFTWWGKDYAQHVWAEPVFEDNGHRLSRLQARTEFIRDLPCGETQDAFLNILGFHASLSGPIRDPQEPKLVKLAASVYVHEGTLSWFSRLFSLAVVIQAADAQIKAEGMADLIQAKPAKSAHPKSGVRQNPALTRLLDLWSDS